MITLISLLIAFSSPAHATKGVSNGGVGVQCMSSDGSSKITLWDFEYAERFEGSSFAWIESIPGSEKDRVNAVIDRLAKVDPVRAKIYRVWFGQMGIVLIGKIPDVTDPVGPMPEACNKVALAVQIRSICGDTLTTPATPATVLIARAHWLRMSVGHRAGLLLHELVYNEVEQRGLFLNSNHVFIKPYRVAHLAALLASDQFPLEKAEYDRAMQEADFFPILESEPPRCEDALN